MEFFGYTWCGPQNYIKDLMKVDYHEPTSENDIGVILTKLNRVIDKRELNGFAYGSFERFLKMKKKGVVKPASPFDIYRLPPTSSNEFGWWFYDSCLSDTNWYKTVPRYPQPVSPNSLILDKVRKNNKYASMF